MWRWLVVWLWVIPWAVAGCGRPSQQNVIETAVAGTLTARPAATAAAFRLSVTPWPTPSRASALPAAVTAAPANRAAATAAPRLTATPRPTVTPRAFADIQASCLQWTEAKDYDGQTQCVCGPVVDATYAAKSNGAPTFLNLGGKATDPNRFTVVIWGDQGPNFDPPPEQAYRSKTICVTGRIKLYKGVAETQLSSPDRGGGGVKCGWLTPGPSPTARSSSGGQHLGRTPRGWRYWLSSRASWSRALQTVFRRHQPLTRSGRSSWSHSKFISTDSLLQRPQPHGDSRRVCHTALHRLWKVRSDETSASRQGCG